MEAVQGSALLVYALVAVIALIVLIAKFKMNPFIVLIVVSLLLGLSVGMPMGNIVKAFETGVGNALGHIALVVGLGTMLGKMMAESGGAERIANTMIKAFGEKNVHWAMMTVAFIVGLPVFFEVGFVLLVPIAFNVAKRTGTNMVLVGIPMVAGLSVVHGLIPPHPAALLAVTAYSADIGRTILFALIVGIPTAIIAGPIFGKLISKVVIPDPDNPLISQFVDDSKKDRELPGFGITLFTILLPVALMLIGSWADLFFAPKTFANDFLRLIGNSVIALLIATLVSFWTFGRARGFGADQILKFSNECLAPIASITLVVGAGAGFGRILMDGGVSKAIVGIATDAHLSPLILGWFVAALIRVATGSATVAMTTACGIVAPIVSTVGGVRPELMVLATGAGSLILSHVNDGGFWLVKEYFNMTVPQTFKTWTVMETLVSVLALLFTLALATVV
ncbi:gluconate transporter (GNT-III system) protein [Herbaspirillum sp. BH-1]|jgi:GntP family gluconate:H+ symporter|uniref:High-affinity gluconate transporter (GNT-III system) transmembrane protein n=2 Tax=Herbaspirillum frisingense TaxID=92645 RepID=A0AAI9N2A8_9BURK|nr:MULTISPECIES: GntP family permease [Herbaspirillum]EOA03215.1 high-affinity gluconate transporter (GNT-III system) transmembrane protein [Herbaspirillum frisingense GSF30]MCI1016622.1 GntP family permease [Herbaspirillum sp. C7C2]MDR6586411.1 GntP family gluconate:H+ symporter [Herbaspirillum frisingense]ONN67468.1 permease DsdX [Herbaspirillum sp. VT-16-41]PLY57094.1 gluconate transporter (GNT-III system) protein [Herbaspirillum sp. BH-1]